MKRKHFAFGQPRALAIRAYVCDCCLTGCIERSKRWSTPAHSMRRSLARYSARKHTISASHSRFVQLAEAHASALRSLSEEANGARAQVASQAAQIASLEQQLAELRVLVSTSEAQALQVAVMGDGLATSLILDRQEHTKAQEAEQVADLLRQNLIKMTEVRLQRFVL